VRAKNLTAQAFIPRLNYSKPSFEVSAGVWEPTSLTNRIALQSAFSFDVVPLSQVVPSQDWSYDIQFFGPTLECRIAKDTEQPYFDRIASQYEAQSSTFIYSQVGDDYWNATYNNNHNGPAELIYSAWSVIPLPAGAPNNWSPYCNITEQGTYDPCDLDPFTDWQTNWPTGVAQVSPEIWIQTSNLSIVCASVNASFDVTIASVGGSQEIIQNNVQIVGNGSYPFILTMDNQMGIGYDPYFNETEEDPNFATTFWSGYSSHVYAMGSILQGNITILESFYENTDTLNLSHTFTPPGYRYMFANATTNVLASGLIACDEIFNTPFKRLHSNIDPEKLPGNNSTEEDLFVFNNTFPTSPGMCRNGSLLRAIQDLANNVTISMLSSSDLTSLEPTPRTLVTSNTVNVYEYSPRFLVLSYAIALFLSCFATAIGLYSLYLNGVSHSVAFSSIVATTRNPDLDSLMRDSSLGALPVKMEVEETRLKFGRLLETSEKRTSEASGVSKVAIAQDTTHFAFGLEGSVGELKNRRTYT
jgi:hypothetical protein